MIHSWTTSRARSKVLVGAGLLVGLAGGLESGCSSSSPSKAGLAASCTLNSDCDSALVCIFGRCHAECSATKDCPLGERCVGDAKDAKVCELPIEATCSATSPCSEPLVCSLDSQCRNRCAAVGDCLPEQLCAVSGVCAESAEVDARGNLKAAKTDAGTSTGGGRGSGGTPGSGGIPGSGGTSGTTGTGGDSQGGTGGTRSVPDAGRGGSGGADAPDASTNTGGTGGVGDASTNLVDAAGVCVRGTTQCSGNGVETCGSNRQWGTAVQCPYLCTSGACTGVCTPGSKQCFGLGAQTCDSSGQWGATVPCQYLCTGAGICPTVEPSCNGLDTNCGPYALQSCCTSSVVPAGSFYRSYDAVTAGYTSTAYPAGVNDFRLDAFEITVGRFRKFVAAYSQTMIPAGAGKNPSNGGDLGWDPAWNVNLPADAAGLKSNVSSCSAPYQTWTTSAGGATENKPINCIDWYEAFAFCIWDGGRLPTEAEWNYAAAGGDEQRVYPWGAAAADCTRANYFGAAGGTDYCVQPGTGAANYVGSDFLTSKWAQADLAGNLWEWALDLYASPYPQTACINCANTTTGTNRVARGGSFGNKAPSMISSYRYNQPPTSHVLSFGARCARTP